MFGMGGSEILVILIVALLFLGPEKLPQAAKQISKGIRDIKKQSRALQNQIESDEQIGGAIRDLKSALRGDEAPVRPKPIKPRPPKELPAAAVVAVSTEATPLPELPAPVLTTGEPATVELAATPAEVAEIDERPKLTMPEMAGEPDPDVGDAIDQSDDDIGALVRPAAGTVARDG
jgi:Tat protein translocase TatB subunit